MSVVDSTVTADYMYVGIHYVWLCMLPPQTVLIVARKINIGVCSSIFLFVKK
jgi:hypothetical protein